MGEAGAQGSPPKTTSQRWRHSNHPPPPDSDPAPQSTPRAIAEPTEVTDPRKKYHSSTLIFSHNTGAQAWGSYRQDREERTVK